MSAVTANAAPLKGGSGLRSAWGQRGIAAFVIVAAFALPQFFDPGSTFIDRCVYALAYVIMALGLNIVVGFAGLLDLGYVAFFAIGAYTTGWFASSQFANKNIHIWTDQFVGFQPGIHLNFILLLIVAAVFAAALGALLGFPTLRLRGDYIAIVTLAFGEIIGRIAINGDDGVFGIGHFNLTNGKIGIQPIDTPDLPIVGRFNALDLRQWYYTALVLVLMVVFVNIRLRDSRLGRAWIAVREDEVAAVSMGIPTVKVKLLAYALGAAMGGVAGVFLGVYIQQVNADQFAFSFSIFVLAMVILGGLGSIWGVIIGSIALTFINRYFIPNVFDSLPSKLGLDFDLSQLGFGIFGFLLVIMMVLRPQGLIPERRRAIELTEALEEEPVYEAQA